MQSNKNFTNELDLQFLSCYNHSKERKKQEELKKDINIKKLKIYQEKIINISNNILNNSINTKKNINEDIPINIINSFLHFSKLCIEHFEFLDISKIVQNNINEFENEQLKKKQNEEIKKKKKNKRNSLKINLNNTTENKIKNINNIMLEKPKKKKKITDFLDLKTIKKCQTFPTQIRK